MPSLYAIDCPLCDHVADSFDSYGDTRQELDRHMEKAHPDQPDPRRDPRWNPADAEGSR